MSVAVGAYVSALDALVEYNRRVRHPELGVPLVLSPLYALFPEDSHASGIDTGWPSPWPGREEPGVFLMFDVQAQAVYVGKARHLGNKLNRYFRYAADAGRRCVLRHEWRRQPFAIATIIVAPQLMFEAAALEEYFIERLSPSDNTRVWSQP